MIPDLSIFCSAAHPEYWMRFYNTMMPTNINFEFIGVGPKVPDYTLPENFHFIQSMVKPGQCFEIALRESKGEMAMNFSDDCWFVTPSPLDELFRHYRDCANPLWMVSPCYTFNGVGWQEATHHLRLNEANSPIMPVCGMTRRQLIIDSGGVDKDFIALFWDLDIAMRVYTWGGQISLANVMLVEDRGKAGSMFDAGTLGMDRGYLDSLWPGMTRVQPVNRYDDTDLLTVTQGTRGGRW